MPTAKPGGPTQTLLASSEDFDQVQGEGAEKGFLCIVEVYASWCGATDAAVSTVSRLSVDFAGRRLKFYQANADRVPALEKLAAKSKPHFLFYKDGEQVESIEGVNAPAITKAVTDHLPEGLLDTEVEKGGEADEDED